MKELNPTSQNSLTALVSSSNPNQIDCAPVPSSIAEPSSIATIPEPSYGSQLFVARQTIASFGHGNLLRTQERFFIYTGKVWQEVDNEVIKRRIHLVYQSLDALMFDKKDLTAGKVNACLQMIATESFIDKVSFDSPRDSIGCLSGELYLVGDTWEQRSHVRENYRTNLIPVNFDSAAKPRKFFQFLDQVFEGDADAEKKKLCLGEFMGYTLSTDCRFEKFMLLHGEHGSNGKSVIIECLQKLLGDGGWSALHPSKFNDKFQVALLKGKFANINSELKVGDELNDDGIKRITSGEAYTCEEKFKPAFTFKSFAKLWFASNPMPHCRDHSGAFFRRPIVLEFNNRFTASDDPERKPGDRDADVNLKADLVHELPGILNFALKGLRRLRANGGFTIPESSKEAVMEWRKSGDQVAQFVAEKCEKSPGYNTAQKALYDAYKNWSIEVGNTKILSKITFGRRLALLDCPKGTRQSYGETHDGITLI